ncbi:efflux RND transporter periplasmic adaptor subunit [Alteromonas lipolytica]|uniref:Efflux transporter periplasmic adaptor subunit n=1 Tax=Alteromonas lipolytica TaxID=1856405 RepID=A0A1E8FBW3_9ALTE|nr:HlyD family efflux transporter periplasmic adaptor subunit [Alteromonas lipolytica]OFI33276.1 efflux transporter periplasmic adaptor subunit [Alteromonas lipolytica]GGF61085.1 RND transporter MFP subunit [Alteromonas lipolytica]
MIKDTSAQDAVIVPKRNKLKLVLVSAAVLITLAISAEAILTSDTAAKSVERASVQIATVERGDLTRDIAATGRIVAANAPQVYSPEEGLVTLLVRAGDKVSKGQAVARVESPQLQNQLQQERSELARLEGELSRKRLDARRQTLLLNKQLDLANVELTAAERESRRAKASIKTNIISQIDFEKAEDELARAKLNVNHAEQEVALAKDTLAFEVQSAHNTVARQQLVVDELERKVGNLTVTASVEGVVGNLFVTGRSLVTPNQPLMTLVDLTAYEAEINVAESFANELGLGMDVELQIGRQTVMGTLSAISPEVTEREVTTRVRFDQNSLSQIRQNQQVTARILLENRSDIVKVRRGSFLQAGGYVAYKLEGQIASRIPIETGATSMREVEIMAGVQPGDQIIISSYQSFEQAESILLR